MSLEIGKLQMSSRSRGFRTPTAPVGHLELRQPHSGGSPPTELTLWQPWAAGQNIEDQLIRQGAPTVARKTRGPLHVSPGSAYVMAIAEKQSAVQVTCAA